MSGILAHGLGDAGALPVPLPLVLLAAGAAVLWTGARLSRHHVDSTGQPAAESTQPTGGVGTRTRQSTAVGTLPAWLTVVVDAPATRAALRVFGLLAAALVLALAAAGPANPDANPATRLVLVVAWAGLTPLSFVAPGAWRAISPLRSLSALLANLTGDPQERGARSPPEGLGWWPAAVALGVFAVVEGPLRGEPIVLLVFLVSYGLVQLGAAAVYGSRWFAHGEAFEVLAAIVGRLSPVERGEDGQFRLANPRDRLDAPVPPGAVAVVGVLIGSAVSDFVTDLPAWDRLLLDRGGQSTGLSVGVLLLAIALSTAMASAAARPRPLAPAVLPVAVGYLFAHYFAVLLIEGQVALAQLAAIAGGTAAALSATQISVRYDLLPGPLAATIQLVGFLVPHLIAVAVGVVLARRRFGAAQVRAATTPLVGIMTLSAVAGTALRYAAG